MWPQWRSAVSSQHYDAGARPRVHDPKRSDYDSMRHTKGVAHR